MVDNLKVKFSKLDAMMATNQTKLSEQGIHWKYSIQGLKTADLVLLSLSWKILADVTSLMPLRAGLSATLLSTTTEVVISELSEKGILWKYNKGCEVQNYHMSCIMRKRAFCVNA